MNKLIMLIGLPGSGKSTFAKELAIREHAEIFSSDEIGFEIYGKYVANGGDVLTELRKRASARLKVGNAIYDATNISSKRRRGALEQFRNCIKECYYFDSPISDTVTRDSLRDRQVGAGKIYGMQASLQVPFYAEGWDQIHFIHEVDSSSIYFKGQREELENLIYSEPDHDTLFKGLQNLTPFREIYNLCQDSSYHSFSVSRHTYYVFKYVMDNYQGEDKLEMLWAALFHDTGKKATKKFEENRRYASFLGHENVSSQLALNHLLALGYPEEFAQYVSLICLLHMRLLQAAESPKAIAKLSILHGPDLLKKLEFFKNADTQAK